MCTVGGASLTYKTELQWGLQIWRWELLGNSKPRGWVIIMIGRSKTWVPVRSYLLHSSSLQDLCFALLAAFFSSLSKLSKYVGEKPFSWAKPAYICSLFFI
jgi:hypothetical protein